MLMRFQASARQDRGDGPRAGAAVHGLSYGRARDVEAVLADICALQVP
jgi:hypothetical protein